MPWGKRMRQTDEERFWLMVRKGDGCWEWMGGKNGGGYGAFNLSGSPRTHILAHRFAYQQTKGSVPEGLECDHLCRRPSCVNPDHIELVTHQENIARGRQATKTHCPYGHPFDTLNTYYRQRGGRDCRKCHSIRTTNNNRTKRAAVKAQRAAGY